MISDKVKIVATADPSTHTPIIYPIGIIKGTKHYEDAKRFDNYLQSKESMRVFKDYGFTINDGTMQEFITPILLSLKTALVAGMIVILLGTLLGRAMARRYFRGKSIVETILMLPMVLPPTVIGFFLIIIFGKNSFVGQAIEWLFHQPIIFTWWAAVIASIIVAFPLMYQSAKSGFQGIDREIEEAARVLGADEWAIFFFISIPLASRALISGSILSLA